MTTLSLTFPSLQPPFKQSSGATSLHSLTKFTSTPSSESQVEREFFLRCVLFGADNTGKHTLISSSFPQERRSQSYKKNDVDFINKTLETGYNTKKYHFWTFNVNDTSLKKEVIWRAYYKSSSAFIFVYDITNPESFEILEEAVKSVLKVIPENEFFGILIGNKRDLEEQRQVSYDAANSFKHKYRFSHFIETSSNTETDDPQILDFLESRLKMTYEAI